MWKSVKVLCIKVLLFPVKPREAACVRIQGYSEGMASSVLGVGGRAQQLPSLEENVVTRGLF